MSSRISRVFIAAVAVLAAIISSYSRSAQNEGEKASVAIVWAGKLLVVPGRMPLTGQSLVIRGGMIERILSGRATPAEIGADPLHTRTVDLSRSFVLPGFFDLHVHLTTEPDPSGALDDVTLTSADLTLRAAMHAEQTLRAGFTTVVDMGTGRRAHELAIYAVRDSIAAGKLPGPRILAVGSPISSPGNSRTTRFQPDVEKLVGPQGVCSGADDCRRAVREQVQRGADVINFYNTGSLLSPRSPSQTFSDEEMRAIVETAHSLNRRVVADGAGKPNDAAGVNAAIRAGADWVDTVIYPDRHTWPLLLKSGHAYAPHLYAVVAAVGDDEDHLTQGSMGWLPAPVLEVLLDLKRAKPAAVDARAMGVQMVFASDAGVFAHGQNGGEFEQYVKAGLTPAEAIQTATINAARLLGLNDSGTLEVGQRADFVAVQGDPLEDIRILRRVLCVGRGGTVFEIHDGNAGTADVSGARP